MKVVTDLTFRIENNIYSVMKVIRDLRIRIDSKISSGNESG